MDNANKGLETSIKSFYDRIRGAGSSYLNRAVTQFVLHPREQCQKRFEGVFAKNHQLSS
jgi:hypothetical protein